MARVLLAVLTLLTVTGCALDPNRDAHDVAGQIAEGRWRAFNHGAAYEDRYGLAALTLDGTTDLGRRYRVELLSYTPRPAPTDPLVAVVRIQVTVPAVPAEGFGSGKDEQNATDCFILRTGSTDSVEPTSCPDSAEPIRVIVPPQAQLTEQVQRTMRTWLRQSTAEGYDVGVLQSRLEPGLVADAATDADALGIVVISEGPDPSCLVGRRDVDGHIEVFSPTRVYQQEGEGGCEPWFALHPLPAPH